MAHRIRHIWFVLFLLVGWLPSAVASEIEVGATVTLVERFRDDGTDRGIPGHPAVADRRVSHRFPSGSRAVVRALGGDEHPNWIQVAAGGETHWIVTRYVASVEAASDGELAYVIGCWNLEYFRNGKSRGFPETAQSPPGPTIPPRTAAQIDMVAQTIAGLNACFLVLSEINGTTSEDAEGELVTVSEELNSLLEDLPNGWDYFLSFSGRNQRVAFLYDTGRVRINEIIEFEVPFRRIQGEDIFARDPIAAHVTLLHDGEARNDLVIVGLHLASGQPNNRNHDEALRTLLRLLNESQHAGELAGEAEHDLVLMGDLNANMFRPPVEQMFLELDEPDGDWDVLAGDDYPATRLSGVPLRQDTSQIDYIIATRKTTLRNGLVGEEITATTADVHDELLTARPPDEFRRDLSDHLPVTVQVRVTADND
jgi:endonuclease/exonuclease/phosphatase family metal-dependent hydrolase